MVANKAKKGLKKARELAKKHQSLLLLSSGAAAINYLGFFDIQGFGNFFYDIYQYDILMHGSACMALSQLFKDTGKYFPKNPLSQKSTTAVCTTGILWEMVEYTYFGCAVVPGSGPTLGSAKDVIVDTASARLHNAKEDGLTMKDAITSDLSTLYNRTIQKLTPDN